MHFVKKLYKLYKIILLLPYHEYPVVCQDIYKSSIFFNFFFSTSFLLSSISLPFSPPNSLLCLSTTSHHAKNHTKDLRETLEPSIIRHEISLRNSRYIEESDQRKGRRNKM